MTKIEKLISRILSGRSDATINFNDLCHVLNRLDFKERIKGDHHIFYRDDIPEIINIQPSDSMAKPYQVKQVRNLIVKYKLGVTDGEL